MISALHGRCRLWQTYHSLNGILNLSYGELENQINRAIFRVLVLDTFECSLRFGAIARLAAFFAGYDAGPFASLFAVFLDNSEAHDFVAIVHKFVDQPFQCCIRVLVGVSPTKESA